jgi:2-polyprenyl-6-methoxyphenol hydroxylase-like FAD-dependent oxidoreductase
MTPLEGIKSDLHIVRDLQLADLPAGRFVLMGDAAHAMAALRGEGGYHAFLDSFLLGEMLCKLGNSEGFKDIAAIRQAVDGYNDEMLKRGRQAVQDSRDQHGDQRRFGPDGKPLIYDVVSLPNQPIVLGKRA